MNNIKPKISIIITVKNAEKYLHECLESIKKQTIQELEIICVYGESKDNTLNILENYQKNDKRIVIYNQDRPGIGIAKNIGIENAKGEYFTFLDADDYYIDSDALQKMYEAAKTHNVKICGALRSILTENGEVIKHPLHRAFLVGFEQGRMFNYLNVQYDYHFHSYIYQTDFIINSDARFAETKVYDDTHFHIRAMYNANNFYVVPVELYCYRCHASYSWNAKACADALKSLIDQLKYTKNHHLEIGHYFAMQRLNYEYGPQIEMHIRNGSFDLLRLMLDAQDEIDNELIAKVLMRKPTSDIIEPMNFPDKDIQEIDILDDTNYLLTPLYNLTQNKPAISLRTSQYYEELDNVLNSKTYKIGKIILWLPKKVLQFLHIK